MTKKDDEEFKNSTKCWIFDNVYVEIDVKIRDNCDITRKYRSSVYKDCNTKVKLDQKVYVVLHNLKNYDSHLVMQVLGKFDFKINKDENGLEKNIQLSTSIISFRFLFLLIVSNFLTFWFNSLVKNLGKDEFKYLIKNL